MSGSTLLDPPSRERKGELGQFFTPPEVAHFMASLFSTLPTSVRLLDAGAGAGALTSAFVSRVCANKDPVKKIEVILYEVDLSIQSDLSKTMRNCQRRCLAAGIQFHYEILAVDFVEEMSSTLAFDLFHERPRSFDCAIVNPPYKKIGAASKARGSLSKAGIETSNLYTGFIALIQQLLNPGGQLVGITPRSFCNGPYFKSFRKDFLENFAINRLHVFDSRSAVFLEDNVLQENIIFHATKSTKQSSNLVVSSSGGKNDALVVENLVPFTEIVHPKDQEKFIHVPSIFSHRLAKKKMDCLNATLSSLGISVSTGRVVDFRLKDSLRLAPEDGTMPLVYPCHFNRGTVHWPRLNCRKPNAILDTVNTRPCLVKSGIYLLTKRFTSKEERRRLVACLFDPVEVQSKWVGFENHLNYFHANGHGLERNLALGLFAFLNSTFVDQYFRQFSGHTQVNATDLRRLTYPDRATLLEMGSHLKSLDYSQEEIDKYVERFIHA